MEPVGNMPDLETSNKKWWSVSAKEQMTTDKRLKQDDIDALKAWLSKQPHLPHISDEQIQVFLAACKFSIELSKKTIDINYTMRTKYSRMWKNRDLDDLALDELRNVIKCGLLPHKKGRPIVFTYKVLPMDPSHYDVELVLRIAYMVQDLSHLLFGPNPEGYIFIVDMENITLSHILHNPLTTYATALKYAQEGSCCIIQGLHFMNSGPILETFLTMIKPFISDEVWKMIISHDKTSGLEKYLEPTEIPRDYNGEGPSIEEMSNKYYTMVREYRPWFTYEETLRVNEEKRPTKSRDAEGIQGSFRKLDLD